MGITRHMHVQHRWLAFMVTQLGSLHILYIYMTYRLPSCTCIYVDVYMYTCTCIHVYMYMHVHVYAVSNSNLTPKFEFEFKFQTCVCCLYPRLGLLLALLWQYCTELGLEEGAGWNDPHWVPLQQLTMGGLGAGDLGGSKVGGREGRRGGRRMEGKGEGGITTAVVCSVHKVNTIHAQCTRLTGGTYCTTHVHVQYMYTCMYMYIAHELPSVHDEKAQEYFREP